MAEDKKTSLLDEVSSPALGDVLYYVKDNGGGSFTSYKIAISALKTLLLTGTVTDYFTITFVMPLEPSNLAQHFNIVISANADFSTPIVDWDSRPVGDGGDGQVGCEFFSGTQWEAVPSTGVLVGYAGNRISYKFAVAGLVRGALYYVRVRFHNGSTWGDWAGDTKSW